MSPSCLETTQKTILPVEPSCPTFRVLVVAFVFCIMESLTMNGSISYQREDRHRSYGIGPRGRSIDDMQESDQKEEPQAENDQDLLPGCDPFDAASTAASANEADARNELVLPFEDQPFKETPTSGVHTRMSADLSKTTRGKQRAVVGARASKIVLGFSASSRTETIQTQKAYQHTSVGNDALQTLMQLAHTCIDYAKEQQDRYFPLLSHSNPKLREVAEKVFIKVGEELGDNGVEGIMKTAMKLATKSVRDMKSVDDSTVAAFRSLLLSDKKFLEFRKTQQQALQ